MTVFANIIGTYNMLDASKYINYKKFINFSSSSVLLPYETFYSASKASGERIVKAFVNRYDKPILTIRPFSIYGEGEADFRFIPTVIRALLKGEKMSVAVGAYHDWVYIKDFIDNLFLLTLSKTVQRGIINMGTGRSWSNLDIIIFLEKISSRKLVYEYEDKMRDFDTKHWISQDATIKSDIKEGLKRTYEYYKQRFKA